MGSYQRTKEVRGKFILAYNYSSYSVLVSLFNIGVPGVEGFAGAR